MELPVNVWKIIYDRIKDDADMTSFVSDRIFPRVVPRGSAFPAVIYQRITGTKVDLKGLLNEYRQVSVWGDIQDSATLELISRRIVQLFHGVLIIGTKWVVVEGINETHNPDTNRIGIHVSIHLKVLDVNLLGERLMLQ